ncbi:hypothetical protein F441_18633 [Phytophthora nicotianae CJ01A1]|uniref:Uncharacterized protein n=2 Tax=Phytophthora nicotianae TaxID=4792 RepID=W2I2Z0_PHYNI|nr:hypothetical protein L915_18252 [Phytophthora nicotianae]ETL28495.1 hypothetical protein L916_18159 [Phytophthora nicotianae]ETP04624.1 hypothetical protein F441_18633 [Phytophthora nicotianae CJ01A1]
MENYNGLVQKERAQYQRILPSVSAKPSIAQQTQNARRLAGSVVREEMDEVIVELVNSYPADSEKAALRVVLESYRAKQLRSACVKRSLIPQRHSSTEDNKQGFINLLCKYRSEKVNGERCTDTDNNTLTSDGCHENKRCRLCPEERTANEDEIVERRSGYDSVTKASTAVQSALTTLKMLKDSNASDEMVREAEQKVDVLVCRWMAEMDPK